MKVSVPIATYNHAKYLSQALDSILMQKVDFEYEIIVGEDCSTDNTREILLDFHERYPKIIKPILHKTNVGMHKNSLTLFAACTGKYIALCDGDDYWVDPYKLQKQVDFLEANPDFSMCFHPAFIYKQETHHISGGLMGPPGIKSFYSVDDLLEYSNFIITCSALIRLECIDPRPPWFSDMPFGDFSLYIIAAHRGKIGIIDDPMGVHRLHSGGVFTRKTMRYNRKRLINTYWKLGNKLGLSDRISFKEGISKWYFDLATFEKDEKVFLNALLSWIRAIYFAPRGRKVWFVTSGFYLFNPFKGKMPRYFKKGITAFKYVKQGKIKHIYFKLKQTIKLKTIFAESTSNLNDKGILLKTMLMADKAQKTKELKSPDNHIEPIVNFVAETVKGQEAFSYKFSPAQKKPVFYGTIYAVLLYSILGRLNQLSQNDKLEWANYLLSFQSEDGLFRDPYLQCDKAELIDSWGWRHLTAHAVGALTALGAKTKHPFRCLEPLYTEGDCYNWIKSLDWKDRPDHTSNTVMNYGVMLQYERDFKQNISAGNALEEIFLYLDETVNPENGLWTNLINMSPDTRSIAVQTSYHLWNLYFYDQKTIPFVEKAIDQLLLTQNELGGFGVQLNSSACEDIDTIDPLCRFVQIADYRKDDIFECLDKAWEWVWSNQMQDGGFVFRRMERFEYDHPLMTSDEDVSNLFATWFRFLSIAYMQQALRTDTLKHEHFYWINCPGYQFWN